MQDRSLLTSRMSTLSLAYVSPFRILQFHVPSWDSRLKAAAGVFSVMHAESIRVVHCIATGAWQLRMSH